MGQVLVITARVRVGNQVSPFSAPVTVTAGGVADSPLDKGGAGGSEADQLRAVDAPVQGPGVGDLSADAARSADATVQSAGAGTVAADATGGHQSLADATTDGGKAGDAAGGAGQFADAPKQGGAEGDGEGDTYTAGGGGSNPFGNPGFESALAASVGYGNWAPVLDTDGTAIAVGSRSTANPIAGAGSGYIEAQGYDDGTNAYVPTASLVQRLHKSDVDATPTVTFSVKTTSPSVTTAGQIRIDVTAYNSSGTVISDTTNQKNTVKLWGAGFGSAANTSIAFSPTLGTVYSKSFNLKTFVESILLGGHTAGEIDHLDVALTSYAGTTNNDTWAFFDSFTAA